MICLGIDIGTTTVRASTVEVRIGPLGRREWHPQGEPLCAFTPYRGPALDGERIERLLADWFTKQKIASPEVGTILVTGEAQRAPNAQEVARSLSRRWASLLSVQLDPQLETVVAAHGSGAVARSAALPMTSLLHLDIGGGTTNLAWLENGRIVDTACLDLAARKWACEPATGKIRHRTAAARRFETLHPQPNKFDLESARACARLLARYLLSPELPSEFAVVPWREPARRLGERRLFFSGGVAACLQEGEAPDFRYGDLGPFLAEALREEARRRGEVLEVAQSASSATAFGISAFGFEVSGVSIDADLTESEFHLPLFEAEEVRARPPLARRWAVILREVPHRREALQRLAEEWARWLHGLPASPELVVFVMRENLGKAFGHYWRKAQGNLSTRFAVLDEIAVPVDGSPGRTIDLKPLAEGGRVAVSLKSLRLF